MTSHDIKNVVLIHGIARSHRCMNTLGRTLKKQGYTVHNIRYHHWVKSIHAIPEKIYPQLADIPQPFHIVAHSMGGLITRSLLSQYPDIQTGKIIMLGTPNHGSEIANYLEQRPIMRWVFYSIYSNPGHEMRTDSEFLDQLPTLEDRDITVIGGTKGLQKLTKHAMPRPNDGTVSLESTKLEAHQHVEMPVGHLWMLYDKRVREHVLKTLKAF